MHAAALRLVAFSPFVLLSGGCGGGGGGGTPVTVTLPPSSCAYASVSLGPFLGPALGPVVVGDDESMLLDPITGIFFTVGTGYRGFTGFDLSSLPPDAEVVSATLTLVQYQVQGTPYAALGELRVDHAVYGAVLDGAAFSRTGPADDVAVLATDGTLGPKSCDVTAEVQGDVLAGRPFSEYRLHFPIDYNYDGFQDLARFHSAGSAPSVAEVPKLVVTYR